MDRDSRVGIDCGSGGRGAGERNGGKLRQLEQNNNEKRRHMSSQKSKIETSIVSQQGQKIWLCTCQLSWCSCQFCIWLGPFWWLAMKICFSWGGQKGNIYHTGQRLSSETAGQTYRDWNRSQSHCMFCFYSPDSQRESASLCFLSEDHLSLIILM